MRLQDVYIGQPVTWVSRGLDQSRMFGHVSGLALNSTGEPIVEVIRAREPYPSPPEDRTMIQHPSNLTPLSQCSTMLMMTGFSRKY